MNRTTYQRGIIAALFSNTLFGIIYLYGTWMKPINGTSVFAWRMIATFTVLWVSSLVMGNWHSALRSINNACRKPYGTFLIFTTSFIIATQMWLFMWGPINGHGLDIAIGYFLFPIAMVVVGRFFLKEKLNRLQWLAVLCAICGVMIQLWNHHSFSWVTAWIVGTAPIYFVYRRKLGISALGGLLVDVTLIFPFAFIYLYLSNAMSVPDPTLYYWLMIASLGVLSALAMHTNLYAGFNLPAALFGMFSYLEPTLLFILSIAILGIPLESKDLWTYLLLAIGIALMLWNNYRKLLRAKHIKQLQLKSH